VVFHLWSVVFAVLAVLGFLPSDDSPESVWFGTFRILRLATRTGYGIGPQTCLPENPWYNLAASKGDA
jgi:hypothetical protein